MITEEFEVLNPKIKYNQDIKIPELNEDEIYCIDNLIENYRHTIELDNLFQISNFNFMCLSHFYTLYNTDRIKRNFEFETTDHIAINGLVNNLISSGKTLLEAIDLFMNEIYKENPQVINDFKTLCTSKKYDESFQYRLLLRLRDFAQHGHLPISIDNNSFCIDLNYIKKTPHFKHNIKLNNQMKNIIDEIQLKLCENPRIAFSISILEYKINITEIYNEFLNKIENSLQISYNKLKELLLIKPYLIFKSDDQFLNGNVIYKLDDENYLHMFDPKGETMNKFHECKENAIKVCQHEKNILDLFNSKTMFVPM